MGKKYSLTFIRDREKHFPLWVSNNGRYEITRTKHGEYRLWGVKYSKTICLYQYLNEAKEAARFHEEVMEMKMEKKPAGSEDGQVCSV